MPGPGFEWIGKEEEKEVLEVLRERWLFRYGDENDPAFKRKVKTLEEMVEKKFAAKHALAVTSGTAALITALSALGIGPGDEVIVPGYTFIASMSSIIIARAVPVLAEIDESLTLDPADVERRITPRTKAIMAVHMLGNPCNIDALMAIADRSMDWSSSKTPHRHSAAATRESAWARWERSGPTRSTSSRPSTPVTAAWWSPTTTSCTSAPSGTTTRGTSPAARASRSATAPSSARTTA